MHARHTGTYRKCRCTHKDDIVPGPLAKEIRGVGPTGQWGEEERAFQ